MRICSDQPCIVLLTEKDVVTNMSKQSVIKRGDVDNIIFTI